ncbi:MAG: hypothetical protein RL695_2236 [Pseudomonadota bacterium]
MAGVGGVVARVPCAIRVARPCRRGVPGSNSVGYYGLRHRYYSISMNISDLLQQDLSDAEMPGFINYLVDRIPGIERGIARLKRKPDDRELIDELILGLQGVAEKANECRLPLAALIATLLEALLSRVQRSELRFADLHGELLLLALDRLELTVEALNGSRPLTQLKLPALIQGLQGLAAVEAQGFDDLAVELIAQVTGFRPLRPAGIIKTTASAIARSTEHVAADLLFFRLLTKQYEVRSPLFKGRRQRLLQLALDTNERAGKPIDPVQLEAAVYMHDVGMMFLPESLWLKTGKLTEDERFQMQVHPTLAAGLLERMEGWGAAAEMVAQHHEMPDGAGYPRRLKAAQICPGAKLLAIIDAFEAVMLKHGDRGTSGSILRAIAEINACDSQFAAEWISPFNGVIRRMLEP